MTKKPSHWMLPESLVRRCQELSSRAIRAGWYEVRGSLEIDLKAPPGKAVRAWNMRFRKGDEYVTHSVRLDLGVPDLPQQISDASEGPPEYQAWADSGMTSVPVAPDLSTIPDVPSPALPGSCTEDTSSHTTESANPVEAEKTLHPQPDISPKSLHWPPLRENQPPLPDAPAESDRPYLD